MAEFSGPSNLDGIELIIVAPDTQTVHQSLSPSTTTTTSTSSSTATLNSSSLTISRVPVPTFDHLHNPLTLLPTAPDLTLTQPRTPVIEPTPLFSDPAPSLVLQIDSTPLRLSGDVFMQPIRPGGNEPSGINEQQFHSVSSDQVMGACEDKPPSNWNPWSLFARRTTTSPRLKPDSTDSEPSIKKRLTTFVSSSNTSPSLSPSHSTRLPNLAPTSLSLPALNPPSTFQPLPTSRSLWPLSSRRLSTWLSPGDYDQDAREVIVPESLKISSDPDPDHPTQHPSHSLHPSDQTLQVQKLRRTSVIAAIVPAWMSGGLSKSSDIPELVIVSDLDQPSSTHNTHDFSSSAVGPLIKLNQHSSQSKSIRTEHTSGWKPARLVKRLRAGVRIKRHET